MATLAGDLRMRPVERELSVARVIECRIQPFGHLMTGFAFGAVEAVVAVIFHVAAITGRRRLLLQLITFVTVLAEQSRVTVEEPEFRSRKVIEEILGPILRRVAALTLRPVRTQM